MIEAARKAGRGAYLAIAACVTATTGMAGAQQPADHADHSGHQAMIVPEAMNPDLVGANPGGIEIDFELLDRDGRLVRDEDFRGRYMLLAFGFTHCAHVCPMMAFNMGNVLRSIDKDAVGIFISVDTERDTPALSDKYARSFHEAMMGLGGSFEQVNAAANNFKVSYAVTKTQNGYTVQHTSSIYVIDPQGTLLDVFAFTASAAAIVEAME